MKKIFFAAIAAAICLTSCKDAASDKGSEAKQKNLDASNAINNAFLTGNTAAIDSFISDDFLDHSDKGDIKGKDSLKAMVKFVHDNMKDMKQDKMHEIADDDYVFSWMHWTGTSKNVPGMPDGPYDMHALEISKFKDGKATEHWTYMDPMEMMKMMPQPAMGNMNKMDTTKMK